MWEKQMFRKKHFENICYTYLAHFDPVNENIATKRPKRPKIQPTHSFEGTALQSVIKAMSVIKDGHADDNAVPLIL